jgi:hypothetical protein
MSKSKQVSIPFESFLAAANAVFELRLAEYGQGYAATEAYHFRYTPDEVEIGVRTTFDKWGNSADFVCRPVPATQEDFDALMAALRKVIGEQRPWPEHGSFDIWPFLRQARRESRNTQRIAAKLEALA